MRETREAACEACGLSVIEKLSATMHGSVWTTPHHDAPCGLPCIGGGVAIRAYRAGLFHRDSVRCPACAPTPPRGAK